MLVSLEAKEKQTSVPDRVVTAKMIRDDFSGAIETLEDVAHGHASHIADQGIWNPEKLDVFDYYVNFHNEGQYDPTHFDVDIDLPEAWSIAPDAGDFVVAVVDQGGQLSDRYVNYWRNPGETPDDGIDNNQNGYVDDIWGWDFVDEDNDPTDTDGHGNMVNRWLAELPNSGTVGVAPGAKVMALRRKEGSVQFHDHFNVPFNDIFKFHPSDMSRLVSAMDYAIDMRLRHDRGEGGADVRVINLSTIVQPLWLALLLPTASLNFAVIKQEAASAIERANAAGILVVAGGANDPEAMSIPAEFYADNLLGVISSGPDDEVAAYSARGQGLELATPLYYYDYSASLLDDSEVPPEGLVLGNSFAAPIVSGAALLAWQVAPNATPKEIRQAIMDGVDRRPGLTGHTVSGGRLNVFRALQHLRLAQFQALPGSVGGQTSAIEDKIEQGGAEVRYHLRGEDGAQCLDARFG